MSVATLNPPAALYREEQNFAWWIYALLAAVVAACGLGAYLQRQGEASVPPAGDGWRSEASLLVYAAGLLVPTSLVVLALRMTTEVTPTACSVWFGWVPSYRRSIPLEAIRRVEVVRYRAIRDHGFWGVRTSRDGERVLTARGDRAVRLHLADGARILIGTQRPEELAGVLERERQRVA